MAVFLARRLAMLIATLGVASLVVFLVMNALPGDPALIVLGTEASAETLTALRAEMGLDRGPVARYFAWARGLIEGDLGRSHTYDVPVAQLIVERGVVTLPLAIMAIAMSTAIAIPIGVFAAARHGRAADALAMGLAQAGVATPSFWLAILLVFFFAVRLGWFPAGGFPGWEAGVWPALHALILPAVALALPQAAILARITRSAVIETMGEDYIRTARAKGLSPRAALWRHGLRNALIPVVTVLGLQFGFLVTGAIIVENVFYLPGLGRLIFQAISQRDLIVVQSIVVVIAGLIVSLNFLVDLAYAAIDPRLRTGGS